MSRQAGRMFKLHKHLSPLKRLRIINCDFTPSTVSAIIGIAKALEEFELSITLHNNDMPRLCEPKYLSEWVSCMAPARKTLKLVLEDNYSMMEFSHGGSYVTHPSASLQFADLSSLSHLELYYDYVLGPNFKQSDLAKIFPSNLETLKFLRRDCRSYPRSRPVEDHVKARFVVNAPSHTIDLLDGMSWDIFIGILEDIPYLSNLRRIILRSEAPSIFARDLKRTCDTKGIVLLEDGVFWRTSPEDNFLLKFIIRIDAFPLRM